MKYMEMCIKCGVRPAVMYITKVEGGKTSMDGYCLSCAKELGLAPVDQMFEKFGIGADEIESINEQMNDMIESMGGPEGLKEMEANMLMNMGMDADEDTEGGAATAPLSDFMNNVFGGSSKKSDDTDKKSDKKDKKKNGKKSMLDTYGTDLTARAALGKVDRVVSRNDEIERVIQILNRRTKNNPILLGEPGVGKTAVAEGLAMRIFERSVPP